MKARALEAVAYSLAELVLYLLAALLFLWAHKNYVEDDIFWAGFQFALGVGIAANAQRVRE